MELSLTHIFPYKMYKISSQIPCLVALSEGSKSGAFEEPTVAPVEDTSEPSPLSPSSSQPGCHSAWRSHDNFRVLYKPLTRYGEIEQWPPRSEEVRSWTSESTHHPVKTTIFGISGLVSQKSISNVPSRPAQPHQDQNLQVLHGSWGAPIQWLGSALLKG